MILPALLLFASLGGEEMRAAAAAGLEGRPPAAQASSLQARVDAAPFLSRIPARNPFDPATFDPGAVRLAQIDAEERARDPAIPDGDPPRRHVNARGVAPQIAASPAVDVESFDHDALGANAHDAPHSRAREPGASVSGQMQRFVDDQITRVGAGPDLDHTAGLHGIDPRLKRRGLRGGRPAFQSRGRGRRHLLAAERG